MNAKTTTKRTKANYLGQLGRLNTYRQGNYFVPENDEGRAILTAQIRCKLKDDDAKERAPWITDAELVALKRQAKKIAFKDIGELVRLKHLERWHDDVRMFSWAACDISPQEAARFKLERDRQNAAKRQAKKRASIVKIRHSDKRNDAVLGMLRTLPKPLFTRPLANPAANGMAAGVGASEGGGTLQRLPPTGWIPAEQLTGCRPCCSQDA
jgi:hypothetical protein